MRISNNNGIEKVSKKNTSLNDSKARAAKINEQGSLDGADALSVYNKAILKKSSVNSAAVFKGNSADDFDLQSILDWLAESAYKDYNLGNGDDFNLGAEDNYKKTSNWPERYEHLKKFYTPVYVTEEEIKTMMRKFFSNSDKLIEGILKNADFAKYGKQGIPLMYSRDKFIADLDRITSLMPYDERQNVFDKIGIEPHYDYRSGRLDGFNGYLSYDNLNFKEDSELFDIVYGFLQENSVNTGDKNLDEALNALINGMPEFLSVIGKKQHGSHDYSVDIHILKVLQTALLNPKYSELSNKDKTALKFSIMLHDIAKREGELDSNHPQASADLSRNIISRYKFPLVFKQRIYELVKNHHWLKEYNSGEKSAEDIAVIFRRKGDINIARIMAEADLKCINETGYFWKNYGIALKEEKQKPVDAALEMQKQSGQLLYTSKIINRGNIPSVDYKGSLYKVIDVPNLSDKELSRIFAPGTAKSDLRFAVHVVSDKNDKKIAKLQTACSLGDVAGDGVLSVSYISPDDKRTINDYRFGLSFNVSPENTVNAYTSNQYSGTFKNESDFLELVRADEEILREYRQVIPDTIKKQLGLSDEEYGKLYDMIFDNKHLSGIYLNTFDDRTKRMINVDKKFVINGRIIEGRDVAAAIKKAGSTLIKETFDFNEVNLYKPIANAFIAKVDSIDEIPDEFLEFVRNNSLPIVLLGHEEHRLFPY